MTDHSRHSDANNRSPGVTIGDVIGGIHNSIIAGRDVIINTLSGSTAEQRALRNRRTMLELVRNTWVKGVLEQSLHGAAMLELGMEERAEAVEHPWDMVLQMPDRPNRVLPPGTRIIDVFDEMNGALLILGEPGSGKTTTLLELARDTIARAEDELSQAIPVVFNLSSWAERQRPLAEWLVEELNTKYHIPKRIACSWVENDDLLLLLDGLDEVRREHQEACAVAINAFRQEHGLAPLAVCSRVASYEALTTRLKLQGAALLQPLTPQQTDRYLEGAGVDLLAVRKTLQHDLPLQELVRSPLMLSIMTLAYGGMSIEDLGRLGSVEARRRHVLDAYVQRMFRWRSSDHSHSPRQTVRWLAWLAQKMLQHNQYIFLIDRMQTSWLETSERGTVSATAGLILGLVVALPATLVLGLAVGPFAGLLVGTFVELVSGLFGALFIRDLSIGPTEVLKWSWKEAKSGFILGLIGGLTLGLVGGLIIGLPGGLIVELIEEPGGELWDVVIGGLETGLRAGLVLGLFFGAILGPILGFGGGLLRGLSSTELEAVHLPNQGIRRSARNAITIGVGFGLIGALASGLIFGLIVGLAMTVIDGQVSGLNFGLNFGLIVGFTIGPMCGFFGGFMYGGYTVIQHIALRFTLNLNNYLPWDLTRFLDYATERIFLRKVGGGYIFVHRLLQDYFASLYQGQHKGSVQMTQRRM
jgi:MFS family permease